MTLEAADAGKRGDELGLETVKKKQKLAGRATDVETAAAKAAADCVKRLLSHVEQRAAAEVREAKAADKGAADCMKRLLTQVEHRAAAEAKESKAAAKAAKAAKVRETLIGKLSKKVAAAAVAAVKAQYVAAPARMSGRARLKSAKGQAAEEEATVEASVVAGAQKRESQSSTGRVKRRRVVSSPEEVEALGAQRGDRAAIAATLQFQQKTMAERLQLALTAEEAEARAVAEGLPLIRLPGSKSGFKSVYVENGTSPLGYVARLWTSNASGGKITLGTYATAEEAALTYARCLGRDAAVSANDGLGAEFFARVSSQPLTRADALRQAAEEGLELLTSAKCATGYRGVVAQRNGWFGAQDSSQGKTTWLGNFRTPEEAALAYARFKAAGGVGGDRAVGASNRGARRAIAAVHGQHLRATGELAAAEVEAVPMESDEEEDGAMVCVEAVQSYAR